mgnify:CR=1 FL=1
MITNVKNISVEESKFTIKKECDRCRNTLYFSEAAMSSLELDIRGNVVYATVTCPICGHNIILYSDRHGAGSPAIDIKTVRLGDD